MPGLWELPSGKKEFLEFSEECLKREIEEETGLKNIKIIMPFAIFDYQIKEGDIIKDSTQINFLVQIEKGEKIKLSDEHQNFAWIERKEINRYALSRNIKKVIEEAFKLINKIELNKEIRR